MNDSKRKPKQKEKSITKDEPLNRYKDRSKQRDRELANEKERSKEREKMRKKRRECERDHNNVDRKRCRREDDYKESSKGSSIRMDNRRLKNTDVVKTREEDTKEQQRRKLDDVREKRRLRVREWQEKRRKHLEEDEIDPLDAFMNTMVIPEVNKLSYPEASVLDRKIGARATGRIIPGEESDVDNDDDPIKQVDMDKITKQVKKSKIEKLSLVDHSKIPYIEFRKNFYTEVNQIKNMTQDEVTAYRKEHELKVHGKDVPKPITTWYQTGLTTKILDTIQNLNYNEPMPVQAQALPVIMSGRDCIAVAKTGSGKTLAFVLPMLRHIMDQPELMSGDGPIALIMAPTRELVQQIHSDVKVFTKLLGLRCVPVYGGTRVPKQIKELKRGAEIVVCTPGRMIDMLCTSGGKITNLRRVSYLVMDEADRMFDMGFGPQITRIVQNTQPNRQTVLFSATFPRKVEVLARKVLDVPVEILVGGRSVVNKDITQLVEIRPENEKFVRLLELLREWNKGKILVFVQTQDKCDALFWDLINKHRYPCLSLHGGKDQADRESTVSDFKSNVCSLLIATSIAARGLDVKELELVVNYDVPNHYEDYVHRVGRTGRAGRKGCAVTFLSSEDERYAPDVVKALKLSNQIVPDDLKTLADGFMGKVNQGLALTHGAGYGGSGFKFNEEEEEVRKAAKKTQAKEYGFEEGKSDTEDEPDAVKKAGGDDSQPAVVAQSAASQQPSTGGSEGAAAVVAAMRERVLAKIQAQGLHEHYEAELEINDLPQNARWKVTHKETLSPISEWAGVSIITRGKYIQPGRVAGRGEKKLYLFIEGATEQSVKRAEAELKRALEHITTQALSVPNSRPGRYSFD